MSKAETEQAMAVFHSATAEAPDESTPLPPELADRWTSAILAQAARDREARAAARPQLQVLPGTGPGPKPRTQDRTGFRPRLVVVPALVAAAAAAILIIGGIGFEGRTLPSYEVSMEVSRELGVLRPAQTANLSPDSVLQIVLRPEHGVHGTVKVQAFLEEGGVVRKWDVKLDRSEVGAFQLKQPLRSSPDLRPGRSYGLIFAIGQKGDGPSAAEVTQALRGTDSTSAAGWQVMRRSIQISPEGT